MAYGNIYIFFDDIRISDHKPSGHGRIKITRQSTSVPQTSEIDMSYGTQVSVYSK